MSTQLVKQETKTALAFTRDQVELVKRTVAKGATDDELKIFLYQAERTGLDPLSRQIHFVKRGGQGTIQTGIDGLRVVADRKGLAGIDDSVYDPVDESEPHPQKATVTVYRLMDSGRCPFTASARWSEYAPDTKAREGFMWRKMPYFMLGKCAEALALRKAFPADLSGIYADEEMDQARNDSVEEPQNPDEAKSRNAQKITQAQRGRLFGLGREAKWDEDSIKVLIAQWGYKSTQDIERQHYELICTCIQENREPTREELAGEAVA